MKPDTSSIGLEVEELVYFCVTFESAYVGVNVYC